MLFALLRHFGTQRRFYRLASMLLSLCRFFQRRDRARALMVVHPLLFNLCLQLLQCQGRVLSHIDMAMSRLLILRSRNSLPAKSAHSCALEFTDPLGVARRLAAMVWVIRSFAVIFFCLQTVGGQKLFGLLKLGNFSCSLIKEAYSDSVDMRHEIRNLS